jgi:hypothetical protein
MIQPSFVSAIASNMHAGDKPCEARIDYDDHYDCRRFCSSKNPSTKLTPRENVYVHFTD